MRLFIVLSVVSFLAMSVERANDCNECVALRIDAYGPMDGTWSNFLAQLATAGAIVYVGHRLSRAMERSSGNLRDGMPTFAENGLRGLKPSIGTCQNHVQAAASKTSTAQSVVKV